MRRLGLLLLAAGLGLAFGPARAELVLRPTRTAPTDLEVSGPFPGGRTNGFLTRDAREKESKKYGLKKARKAPQYSKR
jgi:hypothetical protein